MRSVDRLVAIEGAELTVFTPTGPVSWPESYELYGKRGNLAEYAVWEPIYYTAKCKICFKHETNQKDDRREVITDHFVHCSKVHGYVFDDSRPLPVHDKELQDLIQDCQDYDLPFHGYEDHSDCVKQYKARPDGTKFVACAVHKGNEPRFWLGYY